MSIDVKNAGEQITLNVGAAFTASYRASNPTGTKAHLVGVNRINEIINQRGCDGIRIYYGLEKGSQQIVLVGVDQDGNDMTDGVIVDRTVRCPTLCPVGSALNE